MPIKFRCNYCRQFLGISRNRAGGIVDCPTCGRSIRVPDLEGNVAPLEGRSWNSEDSHLARALDELAALAHVETATPVLARETNTLDEEIPQPLPEPVPLEISVPINVQPIAAAAVAPTAVELPSTAGIADVLRELAAQPAPVANPAEEPTHQPVWTAPVTDYRLRPLPFWWLIAAPAIAALCGVLLGLTFASASRSTNSSAQSALNAVQEPGRPHEPSLPGVNIRGRISYQSDSGEILPDVGASVLVVPRTWEGSYRLWPAGLRPGDSEPDQQVAQAIAAAMQGGLSRTDETGQYQLNLPRAGAYRLIVLSRLATRTDPAPIPAAAMESLQVHLQDPSATIGQREIWMQDVEARDSTVNQWDHQFAR